MIRFLPIAAFLTLLASPVLADGPICGGISLVGQWVGGDETRSDLATADGLFQSDGQVPIAGHFVRMFALTQTSDIRADVRAVPSGDPYISIFDASGAEVGSDDDGAGHYGNRVETSLDPGTYCLAVRSYETGVTDVSVTIGRADADFGEDPEVAGAEGEHISDSGPGCFAAGMPTLGDALDATSLATGVEATASARTYPAYGFTLAEPAAITITATSEAGDPLLRLLDESGDVLAENDDFDGLNSRIDTPEPLGAGNYCAELEDLYADGADVTVSVRAFDPAVDRKRRLDLAEISPIPSDDVVVTDLGALDGSLIRDIRMAGVAQWFSFEMPAGGLLLMEAIGNGADPIVTLFDRVGRKLSENDDGPDGLDSRLVERLSPGSYVIAVRLNDETVSDDIRLLLERYVPAQGRPTK